MPEPNETAPEQASMTDDELEIEPLFPIKGYVILNLLFWAFCMLEILIVRWWLGDIQGVIFFFLLLAVGFTLVSIYDAVYDRLRMRAREKRLARDAAKAESRS